MPKPIPHLATDAAAEAFLEQDLSDLDWTQFKPVTFEIMPKEASLTMRVPELLLADFRAHAKARGVPYQRLIRALMERELKRAGSDAA